MGLSLVFALFAAARWRFVSPLQGVVAGAVGGALVAAALTMDALARHDKIRMEPFMPRDKGDERGTRIVVAIILAAVLVAFVVALAVE